jgi:hypothetical protein
MVPLICSLRYAGSAAFILTRLGVASQSPRSKLALVNCGQDFSDALIVLPEALNLGDNDRYYFGTQIPCSVSAS